jgi:hypothetical protein
MQSDDRGSLPFLKRAMYRIPNHGLEFVPGFCLRNDGIPESMGRVPAFRSLFDGKYDLFRYVRRHNKSLSLTQ